MRRKLRYHENCHSENGGWAILRLYWQSGPNNKDFIPILVFACLKVTRQTQHTFWATLCKPWNLATLLWLQNCFIINTQMSKRFPMKTNQGRNCNYETWFFYIHSSVILQSRQDLGSHIYISKYHLKRINIFFLTRIFFVDRSELRKSFSASLRHKEPNKKSSQCTNRPGQSY